jgi:hypothetical protein
MRKLIVVCVALVATAVFGATGAGSVSAAAGEFDFACTQNAACTFHGEQVVKTVFWFNGLTFSCTAATDRGGSTAAEGGTAVLTESGAEDWAVHTLKLTPTISGCTFDGLAINVTTTGCFYSLTASSKTAGTLAIGCEAGKGIIFHMPGECTITYEPQIPINSAVDFAVEEAAGKKHVRTTWTVGSEIPVEGAKSGIKYTSSGGFCGKSGENGSFRGSVTVKPYKNAEIVAANQISGTIVETQANGKIK